MVYCDLDTKFLKIPKHIHYEAENSNEILLKIENNLTHQTYEYGGLNNISKTTKLYEFEMTLDLPVGEYSYRLFIDNEELEIGLMVFGDYYGNTKEYKSNTNTIQYQK